MHPFFLLRNRKKYNLAYFFQIKRAIDALLYLFSKADLCVCNLLFSVSIQHALATRLLE